MQEPELRKGQASIYAFSIISIAKNPFIRWGLYIIFSAVPATLISYLISGEADEFISKYLPNSWASFLLKSKITAILLIVFFITIVRGLYALVENIAKPDAELSRKDVVRILAALETVVGAKEQRFQHATQAVLSGKSDTATIFSTITKPSDQIILLTRAIYSVFQEIDKTNSKWRVRLCRIKPERKAEWLAWEPTAKPRVSAQELLDNPNSTLNRAITTKSIVIVEDTSTEASKRGDRHFADVRNLGEKCSLMCAPIMDSFDLRVILVVCVSCDKPMALQKSHVGIYSWIMEFFITRISLELSLLQLVEHQCSVGGDKANEENTGRKKVGRKNANQSNM